MIAYNKQSLDNLDIQVQALEAFEKKLLPAGEYDHIRAAHPYDFYQPNSFIRIGLFLLTTIAAACGLGLFLLIGVDGGGFAGILITYSVLTYGALEFFIHSKKMHGSGVDDALLWIASILMITGIDSVFRADLSAYALSTIILIISAMGTIRYADRLMALTAYCSFLYIIFDRTAVFGPLAKALLPFLIMALSIALYLLFTSLSNKETFRHYRSCIAILRIAALTTLYAAGNYYIVREVNAYLSGAGPNSISNPNLGPENPLALSWLWWTLTFLIPIAYIARGLQKKDTLFLWIGMAITTAAIFTFRNYYHIMPIEWILIIGGMILLTGVYAIHRYLRTPKHGFTAAASDLPHDPESLILAETFKKTGPPADTGFRFEGGTTGGGGAAGHY